MQATHWDIVGVEKSICQLVEVTEKLILIHVYCDAKQNLSKV